MHFPSHRRLGSTILALAVHGADHLPRVEVDAEHVDRPGDQVHVAVANLVLVPAETLDGVLRVAEAADRVDVPPVLEIVDDALAIERGR